MTEVDIMAWLFIVAMVSLPATCLYILISDWLFARKWK